MSGGITQATNSTFESACETLKELIQQAQDLIAILVLEYSALTQKEHDDLVEVTRHKRNQLSTLEDRFRHNVSSIEHLRLEVNKHNDLARTGAQSSVVVSLWEELRTVLRQCQYQNNANGTLIAALSCHTRGMLGVIQGMLTEGTVYNGSGRRTAIGSSSYSNRV